MPLLWHSSEDRVKGKMAEPIEATALRAWDSMLISCWWDAPSPDVKEWFNIRSYKTNDEGATVMIKTIRLTRDEALKLVVAIQNGGN